MAFCNSCGASLNPGTRFCNKCGAAVLTSSPVSPGSPPPIVASTSPVASTPPTPVPASGGGALKVILIVVGVIVIVGTLCVASLGFFAWRVAHRAHIRQEGDNVRVETPFGTVESTKDPQEAARTLGVDLYPGAQVLKDGSTSMTFGSVHTASLNSESTDSLDKVSNFYKSRFPNAMVMTSQADQCTIVSNDKKNMITINIKAEGDKTRIIITNVTHSANSSSN
jgi:zinc-ribbon domain